MTPHDVWELVLLNSVEEDAPLWQILWDMNCTFPDVAPEERRRAAGEAVIAMTEAGLVELGWGTLFAGAVTPVAVDDPHRVVEQDDMWTPVDNHARTVLANATSFGRECFQRPDGKAVLEAIFTAGRGSDET
ncbi:hypothetical protein ICW40_04275 [Actinotalea ferrariae]|uniref:hypothetical protein n=1 Tax=Actinotalea ferrariae TaxID=1386098 RepID=UPI001C8BE131|nr:hypothetical protein [Actinotalea ferrariae]MBX9244024.1 hypothetical protein [Actinotalea ferrariae]